MNDYAVIDPATGKTVRAYPTITDAELAAAIEITDQAHRVWSRGTSANERAARMRRLAELHTERREQLANIMVREMGKPRTQALEEVDYCVEIYTYYADMALALTADEPLDLRTGRGSAFIRRQSLGVLLGIMPWNYPLYQVARFAAPNLVVGNTLLLKHAPQCPESAAALEQMYLDAGFPPGAYINIRATNEQVEQVIADPRVQGVSLTGSEKAGAAVAQTAGRHLKKVVLELGGSDPFLLLSTDDMDATVQSAVSARLANSGQACSAAKRFIVIDELYDEFLQKFTQSVTDMVPADPMADDTVLGPLASSAAAERLGSQLRLACEGGAQLVGGGREGNFFHAGVLTEVTADNAAYGEEFFGPVASVYRAASEADAIRLANDTCYGLGSYVFTTDPEQALRVGDAIEAGMVFINTVEGDGPELPFGGIKRSGFGRELGRLGALQFVNEKLIRIG